MRCRRADRQAVLADLDSLPVGDREAWGQLMLDMLDDVVQVPDGDIKWRFRRHLNAQGTRQTVYTCATHFATGVMLTADVPGTQPWPPPGAPAS